MPEYTLRIRRYDPDSGQAAYWDEHTVDLRETQSVLDAILQIKADEDGSIGIRCSCQQAICGSCGVRMNGKPGLACNTHLREAAERGHGTGWNPPDEGQGSNVITVEPMGNMPVIRDLIVDMDAVHWKKIQRVTPWLLNKEPVPEREYIVPHENMVDVTQTMACIQCGSCVSDCLAMEVDPLFAGPAALAKAYRFVGDPRDAQHFERLKDLSEDPHGIYDCTHCFNCIDACPKGVDPMSQIMRLRRVAGSDHEIKDRNNGYRHEHAFVKNIERNGILHESDLLADSYGGKFNPSAGRELVSGLPTAARGLARGKMTVPKLLLHQHKASKEIKRIFDTVEGREERVELNLYVTGYEDEPEDTGDGAAKETKPAGEKAQAGPEAAGAADREPPAEGSVPAAAEGVSAPETSADAGESAGAAESSESGGAGGVGEPEAAAEHGEPGGAGGVGESEGAAHAGEPESAAHAGEPGGVGESEGAAHAGESESAAGSSESGGAAEAGESKSAAGSIESGGAAEAGESKDTGTSTESENS